MNISKTYIIGTTEYLINRRIVHKAKNKNFMLFIVMNYFLFYIHFEFLIFKQKGLKIITQWIKILILIQL